MLKYQPFRVTTFDLEGVETVGFDSGAEATVYAEQFEHAGYGVVVETWTKQGYLTINPDRDPDRDRDDA